MATGNFNNDLHDDLAIGVPGEDYFSVWDSGAVNVIYVDDTARGLHHSGDQFWTQNSRGIADVAGGYDRFGSALATGDFNNDKHDDLAIGVPGVDVRNITDAGAVNVIYGRASNNTTGLHRSRNQIWTQDSIGIEGAEPFDRFGSSLAAGNFDNDQYDDLAIGVPD